MNNLGDIILGIAGYLFTFVVVVIFSTLFLVLAWNHVMPYLFHLPAIDFSQAIALAWVSTSLIKPISFPQGNK